MTEAECLAEHVAAQIVDGTRAGVAMVALLSTLTSTAQVLEPRCPDLPIRAIQNQAIEALAPWLSWSTPADLENARALSDNLAAGLVGATPFLALRVLICAIQSVQGKLALASVGLRSVPRLFARAGSEAMLIRAGLVQLGRIDKPAFDPFTWLPLVAALRS